MSETPLKPKPPLPQSFKTLRTIMSSAIGVLFFFGWIALINVTFDSTLPQDGTGVGIVFGIAFALIMLRLFLAVYLSETYTDVEKEERRKAAREARIERVSSDGPDTWDSDSGGDGGD